MKRILVVALLVALTSTLTSNALACEPNRVVTVVTFGDGRRCVIEETIDDESYKPARYANGSQPQYRAQKPQSYVKTNYVETRQYPFNVSPSGSYRSSDYYVTGSVQTQNQ